MATCPVCHGRFDNATFCPRDGSRLETAADAGALLGGRYRLIRKVGEGAMGVVFEAEHVSIRRRVAVKILQRTLVASPEMVERLRREAEVTSGLGHPNIVECLDFGTEDGQVYLVMEWLDGENLDQRLEREPMSLDAALDIAAQACSGLAEAHERGIVHRDLKPANVFLTHDRTGAVRVKILDFGIAKLAAEQTQLTTTGVLIGTPNYMAPEQALGHAVDARADIYALGVILYELVTGHVPFRGDTPLAVLHQHTAKMPALPSTIAHNRNVSRELDMLVMTCLAKTPGERYQTMLELRAAILRVRDGSAGTSAPGDRESIVDTTSQSFDIEDVARPHRARRVAIPLVVFAMILGVGVVLLVNREGRNDRAQLPSAGTDARFLPSSIADAAIDGELRDAAMVLPDAADHGTLVDRRKTPRFTSETRTTPGPRAGETATLTIMLTDLDAPARAAMTNETLRVRVTIEHFAKHEVVARETVTLDAQARASLMWTPRRGKHHVILEPLAGDASLGRIRFDIVAD